MTAFINDLVPCTTAEVRAFYFEWRLVLFLSRVFVMVWFRVNGGGGSGDDASLNSLYAFAYLVLLSNVLSVDGAKQICA